MESNLVMSREQNTLQVGYLLRERYLIKSVLGVGSSGAVYLIKDQRVKRVKYNLFVLKEMSELDQQIRYQFTFKGVALRQLQHPGLPRVLHVFNDDKNERIYLVMEYVEGINLENLLQQQPNGHFDWPELQSMFEPIISALSYLHRQREPFFHGDIKPVNLILNQAHTLQLVDIGYAQVVLNDPAQTAPQNTSSHYRPPEYLPGKIDEFADIYALGATFYTLLTGQMPVNAMARLKRVINNVPDPLQLANEVVPTIPPDIAREVQRAVSLDPDERFQSITAFWQALNAHMSTMTPNLVSQNLPTSFPETNDNNPSTPVPETHDENTPAPVLPTNGKNPSTPVPETHDENTPAPVLPTNDKKPSVPPSIDTIVKDPLTPLPASVPVTPSPAAKQSKNTATPVPAAALESKKTPVPPPSLAGKLANPGAGTQEKQKSSTKGGLLPKIVIIVVVLLLLLTAASFALGSTRNQTTIPPTTHSTTAKTVPTSPAKPTTAASSSPVASPTAQATQPAPTPTQVPTAKPTATSAAKPTPGKMAYPDVLGSYSGTLSPLTSPASSFSIIIQNQRDNLISGTFSSAQESGNLSGTVDAKGNLQFTVVDASGHALMAFSGGLNGSPNTNNSMGGTYYSCTASSTATCQELAGSSGTWSLTQS